MGASLDTKNDQYQAWHHGSKTVGHSDGISDFFWETKISRQNCMRIYPACNGLSTEHKAHVYIVYFIMYL